MRPSLRPLLALTFMIPLAGCSRLFQAPIPEFDTVEEQYQYATDLVNLTEPASDPNARRESFVLETDQTNQVHRGRQYSDRDYRHFIRAYEAVTERFPEDEQFTPQSKIFLGEFHFLLREPFEAIDYFRDVRQSYPDDPHLAAAALWGMGRVYMAQGQADEASLHFEELVETFRLTEDSRIAEIVERAANRLTQIQYQTLF